MLVAALLGLWGAVSSGGDEGALAPAGAWVTHGGSPARNRASATPPLRGVPHLGWSHQAPGPLVGEPLVWGGHVVVTYSTDDRRGLELLDLRDGAVVDELEFPPSSLPLEPCLWGDTLVVRPGALHAYQVGVRGLLERWNRSAEARFGPPLLFEDEVYVVDGEALVRFDAADGARMWSHPGPHHGRPSLRGNAVHVPGTDEGYVTIDAVSRGDGALISSLRPVGLPGGTPRDGRPGAAFVAVTADHRLLYMEEPIFWTPDLPTSSVVVAGSQAGPSDRLPGTWLFHRAEAAEVPGGWIGLIDDREVGGRLWFLNSGEGYVPLASTASRPDLAGRDDPPCRAGGAVYFAGAAVDLESHLVLWSLEEPTGQPMIPARGAVLVRRGENRIEAWRTRDPVQESGLSFGVVLGGGGQERMSDARAVLADGSIEAGDFLFDERKGTPSLVQLRRAGAGKDLSRHRLHPLGDVQLVLGADDRLVYAAGPTALLRGADALIDERLGADYADLAVDALPAKDFHLVAMIVARAQACGVGEKELKRAVRQLENHAAEGATNRKEEEAAGIEARLAELDGRRPDRLREMAAALPPAEHHLRFQLLRGALLQDADHTGSLAELASLPPLQRVELLREVEARTPGTAGVEGVVRGLLPEGLRPQAPFLTLDWLAFLEAIERAPVTILDPRPASMDLGPEERKLGSAALHWRKDLQGFRSEHLFVITPLSRPGAIARCLTIGELVCETLDEMFAGGVNRRDQRYPLYVHLFESQKEYTEQSARQGGHLDLGWTAGHFDPADNVSRLFLPAGDEDFEDVTRTLVHELAHQWVRNRCPLFTNEEAVRRRSDTPGHWIVEGFASLIEEFVFDTDAWTWTPDNPTSRRRDLVASAVPDQLLPWDVVLLADSVAFHELDPDHPELEIPSWTRLGRIRTASPISLYYAQAQAVAYYLYAGEDGAHRQALLAYLAAWYRGEAAALGLEQAFGATPDELGRRAVELARESLR